MALIADAFPSASLQLLCPGAILRVTALQSHSRVLCSPGTQGWDPTLGPRALKAVGSHHDSCHWGLLFELQMNSRTSPETENFLS